MNILKVKRNGQWVPIPAIKGERGAGVPTGGNTGQYLRKHSGADNDTEWADSTSPAWGDITGTLANQVDLAQALANYYLKSETYTRAEVQALISQISQFSYEVVATLPAASASTMQKIYLVPSASQQEQNVKDEFITLATTSGDTTTYSWEQIGSTSVDLSAYSTTAQMNAAIAAYHDSTKYDASNPNGYQTAAQVAAHHDSTKVDEPATEGTDGQVLATDGEGGRSWITPGGGVLTFNITVSGSTITGGKPSFSTVSQAVQDNKVIRFIDNECRVYDLVYYGNGRAEFACIYFDPYYEKVYLLYCVCGNFVNDNLYTKTITTT